MVMTGEIVECLRNGIDMGKCGVFMEWYRQEKSDEAKESFYEGLEQVFD